MHEVWHVIVLASTLFGLAAAVLLVLASLVFDEVPSGLKRSRPVLIGLVVLGVILVTEEWTVVH